VSGPRSRDLRILVVGRGGREHALAWKLAQSESVAQVLVAPGNGGTAAGGSPKIGNEPVDELDLGGLVALARRERIDLVVVGPEAPLAAGLADALAAADVTCFGPSRDATQLESSKVFAKAFMVRHGIPTARYAIFSCCEEAVRYVRACNYPIVLKASGLAAGKGVILPNSLDEAEAALGAMMVERKFGAAADQVVIEERLTGPELSVLAFCDGTSCRLMPPAQDHKRAVDGDQGPNTGGMGAYAPAGIVSEATMAEIERSIVQRAVSGLAEEGTPFVGVLFAGLMMTETGPRVLEFNCRFGDPETEAILPLLESDLAPILMACTMGALDRTPIAWRKDFAVTVVAASGGYPGDYRKGLAIAGAGETTPTDRAVVFHAGTRRDGEGGLLTDGGRVFAVTGLGSSLGQARDRSYERLRGIQFEGMHYRRDIGPRAL
jgi:phosphoribosylamine--glycine ligase